LNLPDPWKLKIYNQEEDVAALIEFMENSREDGATNNDSLYSLGWQRMLDQNGLVTLLYYGEEIAGMSYTHDFSNYIPYTFRCLSRTHTLGKYRGMFPKAEAPTSGLSGKGKAIQTGIGINVLGLPLQIEHAFYMGAKQCVLTTHSKVQFREPDLNGAVMASSQKLNNIFERAVRNGDPRLTLIETRRIYGVDQNIWRCNFKDFTDIKDPI